MAPEYALLGYLTYKADIYSFGVVALEIVAGKNNMKYRPNEDFVCLLDWVRGFLSYVLFSISCWVHLRPSMDKLRTFHIPIH